MATTHYVISGTLDELKEDFEHEGVDGAVATVGGTVDASHIAIVMDDAIDVGETERIEACIRKLMEKFKEVGYSA